MDFNTWYNQVCTALSSLGYTQTLSQDVAIGYYDQRYPVDDAAQQLYQQFLLANPSAQEPDQ